MNQKEDHEDSQKLNPHPPSSVFTYDPCNSQSVLWHEDPVRDDHSHGDEPPLILRARRGSSEVSSITGIMATDYAIAIDQPFQIQGGTGLSRRMSLRSPGGTPAPSDEVQEGEPPARHQLYQTPNMSQTTRYFLADPHGLRSESDTQCLNSLTGKHWEYYYQQPRHCDTDTTVDEDHLLHQPSLLEPTVKHVTRSRGDRSGSSSPASIEMRSTSLRSYTAVMEPRPEVHAESSEEKLVSGTVVRQSDAATDGNSAVAERMKYESPEDPRNYIINIIANNEPGRVTLQLIHEELNWEERFAEANGTVLEYLQGYQSIFAVSPLDDRVTMRKPLKAAKGRRRLRGHSGYHAMSNRIGSVSCSYVARKFDLELLSSLYKCRGYRAAIIHDVLHVSSFDTFDLFLFPGGVVVWWGMNRCDHWLVEDDFLSADPSFVNEAIQERHTQKSIDELFPMWHSYELDENYDATTQLGRRQALDRFSTNLCFDHYLIPRSNPLRSQVMLTVSYALGRISVVDFFDNMTHKFHKEVLQIPSEIRGFFDYFSAQQQITRLEGELHIANMAITEFFDTPDFLWEMGWLHDYHEIAERQNSSEKIFSWFIAKSDALLQQLANIKGRRHRLFILGSDVFLILLLVADVIFLMTSFILRLYFPRAED
ncbi:hypothetical protein, conserved [Trypanosoma brucei gambiense DAL972]|uniref:DUF155 domain-containing protein n=1 Tax=Trypanosoma brucei gambiense (strain MHOM/CI/86/DAL972) TaxID=679716 RepID=C9ZR20_TRYB9|nr:hypothetical protein, conserved [Trypanosoma brucei gambiense DAL972]CBH11850.1 hypothetical protein, conserved [Trypanosoma brucei gambiense DAL972]|eukprot:XP_011774135.1 hypothetical protein, conserved [Trypanosoma brucei gambiense DAL972]